MYQLSMETMTTSLVSTVGYPVLPSGSEVSSIRSLVLDNMNMSDSPIDPESFRAWKSLFQLAERGAGTSDVVPETIRTSWQLLAQTRLTTEAYLYILKLASKKAGWRGHGSLPMNAQSLAAFLQLWNQIAEFAQEPEFVLVPNGNLQIEWYKDDQHFVELEFQPNNKIIFGVFDGETVIEGVAPVKEIIPLLQQRNFKPVKRSRVVKRKHERKHQS